MHNRLEQLLNFHQQSPGDSFIRFALAKEYEKLGQYDLALDHYLELTESDPGYVGTYYHLGKLYEHFGKPDDALDVYTKGMAFAREANDQLALRELAAARMNLDES